MSYVSARLADRNSHYSIKGIAQLPIRAARLPNCASYLFFFCAAHLANWLAVDKLDICAARLDNRAGLLNARNTDIVCATEEEIGVDTGTDVGTTEITVGVHEIDCATVLLVLLGWVIWPGTAAEHSMRRGAVMEIWPEIGAE